MRRTLVWCGEHGLDPLAACCPHLELYIWWMQEIRRFKPSTVSRRFSVTAGFYRTCVIDGLLEHSPAEHVRRPSVPPESPTLGFTHLQFEALLTAARESPHPCDFALVAMLGLLGLRIFEATGADIADPGEEHGHRVLHVCGKGTKIVLLPLPPAVGRAINQAVGGRARGPILLNSRGARMDRHAATRRLVPEPAAVSAPSPARTGRPSIHDAGDLMKAVRYDRFGGIGQLCAADVPEPAPGPGDVLVRAEAGALNPGALPALAGSSYTPGRDLAGEVVAVGEGVLSVAAGDAVLRWLQSWEAHAQLVATPATQLAKKPEDLSWDVGGSLCTTPMAGLGAIKAVEPRPGETVVISGASGGAGLTAAQPAVRAGATVIGLTSTGHFDLLRRYGTEPVQHGEGEEERIRAAAGKHRVHAFTDAAGRGYINLALALNVPPERIDTVVDHRGAQDKGVKALGTTDAGGLPALSGLADLAASGDLHIPIAAAHPLTAVQDAYRALASRKAHGRIVLHPQDLT